MRSDLVILVLIVGGFTYAFRFLPTRVDLSALKPDSLLSRFLASTGPAAIATLFVAAVLPELRGPMTGQGPLVAGILAVVVTFRVTKSVVGATLAGSLAYGLLFAVL